MYSKAYCSTSHLHTKHKSIRDCIFPNTTTTPMLPGNIDIEYSYLC